MLNTDELEAINLTLRKIQKLTNRIDSRILLGDIRILDGDGLREVGTIHQDDEYVWGFFPNGQEVPA